MALHGKLKDLLVESGLGEIAATVYVDLLKSPASNVWDLVVRTGLNKSSVYRAYEKLKSLKMITEDNGFIKASSLKALVADLRNNERKLGKLADKIKKISPFLRAPKDSIEVFEQLYTPEQIAEAYVQMSEIDYDVSLDFGDFENFVPTVLGDLDVVMKFRKNRLKHATAYAVCTTFGPNTAMFCTREAKNKWKNEVDRADIDYKKKFVVFSDRSDYVLFNDYSNSENLSSVLVKSKPIADFQRMNLQHFSQGNGKN